MKNLRVMVLGVLLACTAALGAFGAEYTADMTSTGPQGTMESTIYVRGNLFRQDNEMQGQKQSIIMNEETGTTLIVMHSQKMYMEMQDPEEEAQGSMETDVESAEALLAQNPDMATAKDLGTEKIEGYTCRVFEVTFKDDLRSASTLWLCPKLETPLKIIADTPMGKTTMTMTNIREGGVSPVMFEPPRGYKRMEMPLLTE